MLCVQAMRGMTAKHERTKAQLHRDKKAFVAQVSIRAARTPTLNPQPHSHPSILNPIPALSLAVALTLTFNTDVQH